MSIQDKQHTKKKEKHKKKEIEKKTSIKYLRITYLTNYDSYSYKLVIILLTLFFWQNYEKYVYF